MAMADERSLLMTSGQEVPAAARNGPTAKQESALSRIIEEGLVRPSQRDLLGQERRMARLVRAVVSPAGMAALLLVAVLAVASWRGGFAEQGAQVRDSVSLRAGLAQAVEERGADVAQATASSAASEAQSGGPTTTSPPGPSPLLFCWSRMQPETYEEPLIQMQLVRRASIFACNGFAVISNEKVKIGDIGGADVFTWVNTVPEVPMGVNGEKGQTTDSFLNTEIFLLAWDTLLNSGALWAYDFVVKVDPDAVFFPDRLRNHVMEHVGKAVYFPNCGKWGGKTLLYGSLEVFSVPALELYLKKVKTCKALPWEGWGEDYYMQHCMDKLGVEASPDDKQVADDRCLPAPCSDYTKVAFHDFKDPTEWYDCFKIAIGEDDERKRDKHLEEQVQIIFKK